MTNFKPDNWPKTTLVTWIRKMNPSCKEVTRLLSQSMDRRYPYANGSVFGFTLRFATFACVTPNTSHSFARLAARYRSTWRKSRRRVFPRSQGSASVTSATARSAELFATPSLLHRQSTGRSSAASAATPPSIDEQNRPLSPSSHISSFLHCPQIVQ